MRRPGWSAASVLAMSLLAVSEFLVPFHGQVSSGDGRSSGVDDSSRQDNLTGGPTVAGSQPDTAAPSPVGPILVQSASVFSSGPSISCRYASSVTAGDLLIVSLGGLGRESLSSDSLSSSWSDYPLEDTVGSPSPAYYWSYVYYA